MIPKFQSRGWAVGSGHHIRWSTAAAAAVRPSSTASAVRHRAPHPQSARRHQPLAPPGTASAVCTSTPAAGAAGHRIRSLHVDTSRRRRWAPRSHMHTSLRRASFWSTAEGSCHGLQEDEEMLCKG
ncbi:uncharacterized protein [Triticum aestivum]|uniref:uncharacterized protein n=1 Tax=Triticum aestivum TaxID=4565 RepID=UPI001D017456|nr:uncharacterized protein LOC123046898 [Triticum aestivum]